MRWLLSFMGEISHLKNIFKSFQGKKPEIYPCGAFLFRVVDDFLSKCPNPKKTPPCPKKFLFTQLEGEVPYSYRTNGIPTGRLKFY